MKTLDQVATELHENPWKAILTAYAKGDRTTLNTYRRMLTVHSKGYVTMFGEDAFETLKEAWNTPFLSGVGDIVDWYLGLKTDEE